METLDIEVNQPIEQDNWLIEFEMFIERYTRHNSQPDRPLLQRGGIHTLNLPQIPHLITAVIPCPTAVFEHKGRAALHDVRWLAVVAVKEDDDIAEVFVIFVDLEDRGCPVASKVPLTAAVDFELSSS